MSKRKQQRTRAANGAPMLWLDNALMVETDSCLLWPYSKDHNGYGQIRINGKIHYAHRVLCERKYGPPPSHRYHSCHSCGNGHKGCCNWRHLRWGTPSDNQADRIAHGTSNRSVGKALTIGEVKSIRASSGPQSALAIQFGVSQSTISLIRNNKIWRWVDVSVP